MRNAHEMNFLCCDCANIDRQGTHENGDYGIKRMTSMLVAFVQRILHEQIRERTKQTTEISNVYIVQDEAYANISLTHLKARDPLDNCNRVDSQFVVRAQTMRVIVNKPVNATFSPMEQHQQQPSTSIAFYEKDNTQPIDLVLVYTKKNQEHKHEHESKHNHDTNISYKSPKTYREEFQKYLKDKDLVLVIKVIQLHIEQS
jgi:hypothetical protein